MKRLIIYLTLLALCTNSCEKFFTLYPGNSVTEGNFYQTEEDFNQAVRGCYARLKSNMSFHLTSLAYRSDECIQVAMATSNQNQWDFDHFVENSSCAIMSDIWNAWYSGIYRCNDALNHMEGKDFPKLAQYQAEAIAFLQEKFQKRKIFLKYDSVKYDADNNLLCYVYLDNKTFINNHLIRTGYVGVDTTFDYACQKKFLGSLPV